VVIIQELVHRIKYDN